MFVAVAYFFRIDLIVRTSRQQFFRSPSVALESTAVVILRVMLVRSAKNWFMLDDRRGLV